MYLCAQCKTELGAREEIEQPFPMWTLSAGSLASLVAAATGALFAIPIALLAGAVTDMRKFVCDRCQQEMDHDTGLRLMEWRREDMGRDVYRPFLWRDRRRNEQLSVELPEDCPHDLDLLSLKDSSQEDQRLTASTESPPEFVYDEITQSLVPLATENAFDAFTVESTIDFGGAEGFDVSGSDGFGSEGSDGGVAGDW